MIEARIIENALFTYVGKYRKIILTISFHVVLKVHIFHFLLEKDNSWITDDKKVEGEYVYDEY